LEEVLELGRKALRRWCGLARTNSPERVPGWANSGEIKSRKRCAEARIGCLPPATPGSPGRPSRLPCCTIARFIPARGCLQPIEELDIRGQTAFIDSTYRKYHASSSRPS